MRLHGTVDGNLRVVGRLSRSRGVQEQRHFAFDSARMAFAECP
jgi:hypothetical protein